MGFARRDLFKRLLSESSARALRLIGGTPWERLAEIGDDSRLSAEEAGLALGRRRTEEKGLRPSEASRRRARYDASIRTSAPVEVEPIADAGDEAGI